MKTLLSRTTNSKSHTKTLPRCSLVLLAALLAPRPLLGADYSIDWRTIDGGGGASANAQYALAGTIGQPDAGMMTGGPFVLTGGFWAWPVAVQTTNAPLLKVVPAAPGRATLSWAPATPGFVLQESLSLSPAQWTNSPSGATNPVTVSATAPARFYRVFKP